MKKQKINVQELILKEGKKSRNEILIVAILTLFICFSGGVWIIIEFIKLYLRSNHN